MDPEHEQKEEISAEFALHDAMDCILQYLNTRDLCRAAQVSRAWNEAVKLEFSRRGPEIVRLPDTYDSRLTNANGPKFFASNELRSKPEFTLMLCGPTPRTRIYLNVETSLMTAYKPHLPGRLMIIAVDAAMLDAEEIKSCPRSMSAEFAKTNGIVAFLLPKFRQVQIKVGFCASHTDRPSKRAKRVVHSIMPDDWNSESTILLFGRIYYTIHEHVLSTIKKKWVGRHRRNVAADSSHTANHLDFTFFQVQTELVHSLGRINVGLHQDNRLLGRRVSVLHGHGGLRRHQFLGYRKALGRHRNEPKGIRVRKRCGRVRERTEAEAQTMQQGSDLRTPKQCTRTLDTFPREMQLYNLDEHRQEVLSECNFHGLLQRKRPSLYRDEYWTGRCRSEDAARTGRVDIDFNPRLRSA